MLLKSQVTVLDIQRMSTEDGPGLRTTLFLKGCSLHCDWCHNPESIDLRPVVQWNSRRCIGCDSCREICPNGALIHAAHDASAAHAADAADAHAASVAHTAVQIRIDRSSCYLCYRCVAECPAGALQVKGEQWDREELLQELLKDRAYFGEEGGITLSGGEPLLQAEAALWLLKELKREGLKTALDTAGQVPLEWLLDTLEYCDLLLYDLKLIDSELHRKHTGSGNEIVFANLLAAAEAAGRSGTEIWIRTPLIPGVSATVENLSGLAGWIGTNLGGKDRRVSRWELCTFNNLCLHKYQMLGQEWLYRHTLLLRRAELDFLAKVASESLGGQGQGLGQGLGQGHEIQVQWTGAAAPESDETDKEEGSGGEADD